MGSVTIKIWLMAAKRGFRQGFPNWLKFFHLMQQGLSTLVHIIEIISNPLKHNWYVIKVGLISLRLESAWFWTTIQLILNHFFISDSLHPHSLVFIGTQLVDHRGEHTTFSYVIDNKQMKMRVSGITTDFKALCCKMKLILVPTKFYHCLLIICQVKVTDSS